MMNIDKSWIPILHLDLYKSIIKLVYKEKNVIPSKNLLLKPFSFFPLHQLKIIILGQDPYPNKEMANGLAFSVKKNSPIPPTLKNIFKEIENEYKGEYKFEHGDLTKWAEREKILLINSSLTNIENEYNKHHKFWEKYTDIILQEISLNTKNVCFVLLGNYAKSKKYLIDSNKHYIIESIHPSPQIAFKGFFNSNIFKKIEKCVGKINWQN